jgi:hypothetical protein
LRDGANDALANADGVLRTILGALRACPHPTSPARGEPLGESVRDATIRCVYFQNYL